MKKRLYTFLAILLFSGLNTFLSAQSDISIFEQYPWLISANIVAPEECNSETIEVYQQGIFSFLLVTDQLGVSTLYNQDGIFYCQNSPGYDCVMAYNFDAPADTWSCSASDCPVDDELLTRILPPLSTFFDCEAPIRITQFEYEGSSYFRTYYGRTRAALEGDGPCPAQEFFNDVKDCEGTVICLVGLVPPPPDYDEELCVAIQSNTLNETEIWTNPDASCPDVDPFSLPVIQDAINQEPYINEFGVICLFIEEIIEIDYQGFKFYRINEGFNISQDCPPLYSDRFFDCEGNFIGGITPSGPICSSESLCTILNNLTETGTVIWSFEDESTSNAQIFNDYPWLSDIIDPNACSAESIEVYQSGVFNFIFVTDADGISTLYNQDGLFYCQNTDNYDCVTAYNFDDPVDFWECDESCSTYMGTIIFELCDNGELFYFIETDDGQIFDPYFNGITSFVPVEGQLITFNYVDADFFTPCSIADKAIVISCIEVLETPSTSADCENHSGTLFFDQCDDGTRFFFIRTESGEVLDAYYSSGITFDNREGIKVNFDFYPASFSSPCSIADQAVIITCIEEELTTSPSSLFTEYPFLEDLVDPNNCMGISVEEYDLGNFSYLFVRTGERTGQLYFEDGTFYCLSTATYDCITLYNLGTPSETWTCGGSGILMGEKRSANIESSPGFTVFPNPTNGIISLRLTKVKSVNQSMIILDALGRIIHQKDLNEFSEFEQFDLGDYNNGVYYIIMQSDEERIIKKIIKQE